MESLSSALALMVVTALLVLSILKFIENVKSFLTSLQTATEMQTDLLQQRLDIAKKQARKPVNHNHDNVVHMPERQRATGTDGYVEMPQVASQHNQNNISEFQPSSSPTTESEAPVAYNRRDSDE